jgi:hypothetical protein
MADVKRLEDKLDLLLERLTPNAVTFPAAIPAAAPKPSADVRSMGGPVDVLFSEELYQQIKARLVKEAPALIRVLVTTPEIEVQVTREVIQADAKTAYGLLALLIAEGFFDQTTTGNAAWNEMKRRGFAGISARVYEQLPKLTTQGSSRRRARATRPSPR